MTAIYSPIFDIYIIWTWRDVYRAITVMTQGLGYYGLIRRASIV